MSNSFLHKRQGAKDARSKQIEVVRYRGQRGAEVGDRVAIEEPFEIRLGWELRGKPVQKSISVTMRTPGNDEELAAGFLFAEALVASRDDIDAFEWCESEPEQGDEPGQDDKSNILRVRLAPHVDVEIASLQRHFYTTSSCGVCGKASIEALEVQDCEVLEDDFSVAAEFVSELPHALRRAQRVFEDTGGLHAAGLFDEGGELLGLFEDVGRHNAMDKLVGARLLDDALPLSASVVVWSGRASFELVQKALRAQVPVVVAVGAPSSLAIELADAFGMTLVGFARDERFNVYTHPRRIQ